MMQPWTHFTPPADYLKDRVIMITGAGQGLGEATALACARAGATVLLVGRSERKLTRIYDAIVESGYPTPAALPVDFTKMTDQDCSNFANLVWKEFDRIDGIVHCANGFSFLSPLINQKLEEWVDMFRANVAAPFALTRNLLPLLKRAEDASVVFVGEEHGLNPKAYWGGYAVSRAGQHALSTIAADEWDNIPSLRVNELIPGAYRSPFRLKTHPAEDIESLPTIEQLIPAMLWLIGPSSKGQTGHCYHWSDKNA